MNPNLTSGETAPAHATVALEPIYLHLSVTDPETVSALTDAPDGRERQELALTALKIGLLALKGARGTVDAAAVRNEGDRLLGTLEERLVKHRELMDDGVNSALRRYFDPQSGVFQDRVQRLLRQDGELATVIGGQVAAARQSLNEVLTQRLGENSPLQTLLSADEHNAFIGTMRGQFVQALDLQARTIVGEFSLDRTDSALSRLVEELKTRHGDLERQVGRTVAAVVEEFSLDKEDSALSRLVGRVEVAQGQISAQFSLDNPESGLNRLVERLERHHQAQTERAREFEGRVALVLERLAARKEVARRSTTHGNEFEVQVGEQLVQPCHAAGDLFDAVGEQTGIVPRSKVGDFVVTLGPDAAAAGARIVVEAKASAAYTLKKTLDEADEARRNRGAAVCLFVHAAETAPAGLPELNRWGNDIVVVWDATDPHTDIRLRASLMLAKAMCLKPGRHGGDGTESFAAVDGAIEAIRKQLQGFEEIQTAATTVVNSGDRIRNRARIMVEEIDRRMALLVKNLMQLRESVPDRQD